MGREDRGQEEREGFISLYLSIHRLLKGPRKFLMRVLESLGKVLDFFVRKRVGTLIHADVS